MKRLLYILLSFVVFTACEDDKDTLPYPMNELDGTYWEFANKEFFYYDENGALIKHIVPDFHWEGSIPNLSFKGNAALEIYNMVGCDEFLYSIYWKDRKMIIGYTAYDLVEYNDSYLVRESKILASSSRVPGSSSYTVREMFYRKSPQKSWEEYMKYYGINYDKHY